MIGGRYEVTLRLCRKADGRCDEGLQRPKQLIRRWRLVLAWQRKLGLEMLIMGQSLPRNLLSGGSGDR